jgi:hypothetical protein
MKIIDDLSDSEDLNSTEFTLLRDATCCRLALFNARRGGESSRVTIDQWESRQQWFRKEDLERVENQTLFEKMQVIYATGKGNHLISIIIPNDCVKAMDQL